MAHKDNTVRDSRDAGRNMRTEAQDMIAARDYAGAHDLLVKALKENPTAEAQCDVGEVLAYMGKKNEAVVAFERALKLDPSYHKAYACIAELLILEGHLFHALDYYTLAMKAAPDNLVYRQIFLLIAGKLKVKAFNKELKNVIIDCLRHEELNFLDSSSQMWWTLLRLDPSYKAIIKATGKDQKDTYGAFRRAIASEGKKFLDPYFLSGLPRVIVGDTTFEKLITYLRRFLLEQYDSPTQYLSTEEYISLTTAVSYYCLATEYIFDTLPEEKNRAGALRAEAHKSNARGLAILACYAPLSSLPDAGEISVKLKSAADAGLVKFAQAHIDDYLEQLKIRKTIPAIGKISNETSLKVREQYEEFPYPRWNGYAAIIGSEEIEGRFRESGTKILVAGCGTGQEAVNLAKTFPKSEILAVDLSLTSLSYGIKRARDHGITNIDFRQGDILELGALGEKFDYIASGGVLHHMADPDAGLAALAALLKPDGIMRIGLYSEIARRHIVEARNVIREKGYESTAEDIRRFRRDADKNLSGEVLESLQSFRDYFTLSECRDLIFHVQEHRFTLPLLKQFLDRQNLEFMRFHHDPDVLARYTKECPGDPDGKNLDLWQGFEERHPDTFIQMYRFWCRKKPL